MTRPLFLFLLCAALLFSASKLRAEEEDYFPRLRYLQDLIERASGTKFRDDSGILGQEAFTFGASAGYQSDYYWRGFQLYDSDLLFKGDAYINVYGIEASAWGMWDLARSNNRPVEADYRIRYQFELEGALVSAGYTFFDFSGSDATLGRKRQGFGKNELESFPDDKFPATIHELQVGFTYFTSVIQSSGANLRFTMNYFQRLDDEGSRVESSISLFVDSPQFTVFGDFFELITTNIYQHRYLNNYSGFQGQLSTARAVYNLDKYRIAPIFIVLEAKYYVAFDKDFVDGFFFGGSVHIRF